MFAEATAGCKTAGALTFTIPELDIQLLLKQIFVTILFNNIL